MQYSHLPPPQPDTAPRQGQHGNGVAALVFLIMNLSSRFEKTKKAFQAISRRELAGVFYLGDTGMSFQGPGKRCVHRTQRVPYSEVSNTWNLTETSDSC